MDDPELSDSEEYKYTPLDLSKPSIRLLEILPHKENGCITLSLTHVYLDDFTNQYHTLTYTWGPKEPTFQIFIDGKSVKVRKNIYLFLVHCYETAVVKGPLAVGRFDMYQPRRPEREEYTGPDDGRYLRQSLWDLCLAR